MELILGIFIGASLGILMMALFSLHTISKYTEEPRQLLEMNTKLVKENAELRQENLELKEIRKNAETRAMNFARTIKKIEDIALGKGQGTVVDRFDKIIEVIVGQNK